MVVWEEKWFAAAKSHGSTSDDGDQLKKHIDEPATGSFGSFMYKIDLFMRSHILPRFDAGKIRWWLSLSGGKDSFAMADGLRQWYLGHGAKFNSVLFTIDQWHGDASASIREQISWQDVQVIEANALTVRATRYETGQQAPCRQCSDVRRDLTDRLVLSDADPSWGDS